MVYSDSLGTYYAFSKDPAVPEVLKRAVNFHRAVLWSDGTSASSVDERVIYHKSINTGNVGFSFSPEGRGFVLSQLAKSAAAGRDGRRATLALRKGRRPPPEPGTGSSGHRTQPEVRGSAFHSSPGSRQ